MKTWGDLIYFLLLIAGCLFAFWLAIREDAEELEPNGAPTEDTTKTRVLE